MLEIKTRSAELDTEGLTAETNFSKKSFSKTFVPIDCENYTAGHFAKKFLKQVYLKAVFLKKSVKYSKWIEY